MKFKAAVTENAPDGLLERLNAPATARLLMEQVVEACLHVAPSVIGPATHYVQKSDTLIPVSKDVGVVVGLTMVSTMRTRSDQDFADALGAIEDIYAEILTVEMPVGSAAQLFVAIALDGEVEAPPHMGGRSTNLLETVPRWVEGSRTDRA
jgi:hypothetical protein